MELVDSYSVGLIVQIVVVCVGLRWLLSSKVLQLFIDQFRNVIWEVFSCWVFNSGMSLLSIIVFVFLLEVCWCQQLLFLFMEIIVNGGNLVLMVWVRFCLMLLFIMVDVLLFKLCSVIMGCNVWVWLGGWVMVQLVIFLVCVVDMNELVDIVGVV